MQPGDFADLYERHRTVLVQRLALIVGDVEEANDLAQEAFVRAMQRGPWASDADLSRWLAVVGMRLAIDERRRRKRWGFFALRKDDVDWATERDPDLWHALEELEPRVRAALVLTVLDGYTQQEVADALEVPRGTVASWLWRAKEGLRASLKESE